jgi:hypothetical protein
MRFPVKLYYISKRSHQSREESKLSRAASEWYEPAGTDTIQLRRMAVEFLFAGSGGVKE